MKFLVLITVLVASATAQLLPFRPFGYQFPFEDQYAASLGGAPVGLYDKKTGLGWGPNGGYGSDVSGASLGGAKVGLYGKENQRGVPAPLPFAFPAKLPYLPPGPVQPKLAIRPRPWKRTGATDPWGRPVRPRVVSV